MKTLYIDCSMGAAGDMVSAALLELMPDPSAAVEGLNALGIPHVAFSREPVTRCGIAATRLVVKVDGVERADFVEVDFADRSPVGAAFGLG